MNDRFRSKRISVPLDPWTIRHRQKDLNHCQFGNVLTQIWANKAASGKLYLRVTFRRVVQDGSKVDLRKSFYPGDLEGVSAGANWARLWLQTEMRSLKPLLANDRSGRGILGWLGFKGNQKLGDSWKSYRGKQHLEGFCSGQVVAEVWANQADGGLFYFKVSFKRAVKSAYRIDFADSFSPDDLYDVWNCVDNTICYLRQNEAGLRLVSSDEKKASPAGLNRRASHNNRPKR